MGGRGAMMNPANLRVYHFETVKFVDGFKVLEPKKKDQSWKMPYISNTHIYNTYRQVQTDPRIKSLKIINMVKGGSDAR